jgi:dUTP pyrophosphatase
MEPIIKILRLRPEEDADVPLPQYMTPDAAGMDICAAVRKDTLLGKGQIALLPTGFAMALPRGYEAQIRPRSGLAVQHGIGMINSPAPSTPITARGDDRRHQLGPLLTSFAR